MVKSSIIIHTHTHNQFRVYVLGSHSSEQQHIRHLEDKDEKQSIVSRLHSLDLDYDRHMRELLDQIAITYSQGNTALIGGRFVFDLVIAYHHDLFDDAHLYHLSTKQGMKRPCSGALVPLHSKWIANVIDQFTPRLLETGILHFWWNEVLQDPYRMQLERKTKISRVGFKQLRLRSMGGMGLILGACSLVAILLICFEHVHIKWPIQPLL